MEHKSIGEKIRNLRLERQMSLGDLNKLTGVAIGTIGDIERGKVTNPGIFTLKKIARALGVSMLYFLDDDPALNIKDFEKSELFYDKEYISLFKNPNFKRYLEVTKKAYKAGINPQALDKLVEALITYCNQGKD